MLRALGRVAKCSSAPERIGSKEMLSFRDEIRFGTAWLCSRDCEPAVSWPLCAPSSLPLGQTPEQMPRISRGFHLLMVTAVAACCDWHQRLCAGGVGGLVLAEPEESGLGKVWAIVTLVLGEDTSVPCHRLSLGGWR